MIAIKQQLLSTQYIKLFYKPLFWNVSKVSELSLMYRWVLMTWEELSSKWLGLILNRRFQYRGSRLCAKRKTEVENLLHGAKRALNPRLMPAEKEPYMWLNAVVKNRRAGSPSPKPESSSMFQEPAAPAPWGDVSGPKVTSFAPQLLSTYLRREEISMKLCA